MQGIALGRCGGAAICEELGLPDDISELCDGGVATCHSSVPLQMTTGASVSCPSQFHQIQTRASLDPSVLQLRRIQSTCRQYHALLAMCTLNLLTWMVVCPGLEAHGS